MFEHLRSRSRGPTTRWSCVLAGVAYKSSSRLITRGSSQTVSSSGPYIDVATDAGERYRGVGATIEEIAKLQGLDNALVDFLVILALVSPRNVRGFIGNAVPPSVARSRTCEPCLLLVSRRQQVPSSLFRRRLGCKRLHHRCVFIHRWFHA